MKSFVLKGNICYSADQKTIRTVEGGYAVCVDGVAKGVYETLPEKYAALVKLSIKVSDGEICGVNCTALPVLTYSEGHSWQPRLIEEGAERDNVSSFLSGNRETPN